MKMFKNFLGFVFLLSSVTASAKLVLPSVIDNNMVLQRNSKVALWGSANKGVSLTVITSWNKKTYTTKTGADGSWRLMVETPEAGGPYTIRFNDGEKLELTNILIGEVWLCSGQSNMEMPVEGFKNQPIRNANDILLDADDSNIRLFRLERAASVIPSTNAKASGWQQSNAESVKKFSAVGYQFAKMLQQKLKVPVGVIGSYWGGTMVEAWMNEKALKDFPEIKLKNDTAGTGKHTPAVLFNAMIQPLVGYGIKGVLWYQGEQNRSNPQLYDRMLASMVKEWRGLWNEGEWPFYYVQIAPFKYNDKLGPAAPLREAQARAIKLIPNSAMVVTMDVGEEKSIHPADKTTVSKRLLYCALANTYGYKGLPYASPMYASMKTVDSVVIIRLDHAANGLTSYGKPLTSFEIAGADRVFYPAEARIIEEGLRLASEKVKTPVAVRYAYKDWIVGEVYNTEGLPLAPFRTDDW